MTIVGRKTHTLKKFVVRGNLELLCMLKEEKHLRINATFSCVRKRHKEMLVAIVYNEDTETYAHVLIFLCYKMFYFLTSFARTKRVGLP